MRRCALSGLLVVVALAGCNPDGRSLSADANVEPDAIPRPRNDPGPGPSRQPFAATFVTPAGQLDARYLFAQAVWGDCNPPYWELKFSASELGVEPTATLTVSMPPYTGIEVSGMMAASASYQSAQPLVSLMTQNATFEATRIDYPGDGAPRLIGHFAVTDPAWTIDLDLDVLALSTGCI